MTSEIRVNKLTNRIGLSTVTFADSGIGVTVTGRIDPDTDSARDLGTTSVRWRNAYVDTYYGDGSNLTGISAGTALSGSTNNTVCTVTGANAIQGEAGLTYDGSQLIVRGSDTVTSSGGTKTVALRGGDANNEKVNLSFETGAGGPIAVISGIADATGVYPNTTGSLTFNTQVGGGVFERVRILSSGELIIGHTAAPFGDGDPLQLVSTSSGEGLIISNYSANDYGTQIAFLKSRSAAVGNTILQNGDRIGELNFYGNDGSGRSLGAQISVRVSDTPSNNNTPSTIYFNTGSNQSMTTKLMVTPTDVEVRSNAKVILPSSSSGDYIRIYAGSGTGKWDLYSNGQYLRISDNDSAGSVRIDTRLGVGSAANHANLCSLVNATGGVPTNQFIQTNNNNHALQLWNQSNSASYVGMTLECRTSGASGWLIANEWDSTYKGDLIFRGRNGGTSSKERMHLTHNGKIFFGSISDWGNVSGIDHTDFAFTFSASDAATHPNQNNRDFDFVTALQVHTPVRDNTNTPAIVIKETGGQMSGRNSLVFFNGDYNSGAGYIKSRIYTQVGSGYNSTQFYIDVADSSKNHQQRFRIDTSGNFHGSSSNNISDQRLKKDIATITDPLTKIKGLTGRTFKWKEDSTKFDDKTKFGFVAQEVETIVPELVSSDGLMHFDANDKICDEFEAVSHSKSVVETGVIPITVEAIKVLIAKVETLEQENISLRARITNLEGN